jgi:hypothetical protein
MTLVMARKFLLTISSLALAFVGRGATAADATLPDASTVMERVLQRAEAEDQADSSAEYSYEKRSTVQELDASGNVTKSNAETYNVFPIRGVPYSRLVMIDDRNLTEKQLKEQDRKEEEFRNNLAKHISENAAKTNEGRLDKSLIDRFVYHVEGRGTISQRRVIIVSFRPKPDAPQKNIADRVLGRLAGTLWVDEQDWEIARLKVGLTTDLSLGLFGMVGSIKEMNIEFEQTRLPDGIWMTQKQTFALRGRKVFSSMNSRTVEESSKFRKN